MLPLVTITIPTYARVRWLEQAVFSALAQEYDGAINVIILNDCPRQQLAFNDPRVRIVNAPQRFPTLGDKRNTLTALVATEWLALLDDDDFLLPWHCQTRMEEAVRSKQPVVDPSVTWFYQRPSLSVSGGALVDTFMRTDLMRGRYPAVDVGEDRLFREALRNEIGPFHSFDNRRPSYVYCWGNGVYHVSGQGENGTGGERFRADADARMNAGTEPTGVVELRPHRGFDPAWAIEALTRPYPYQFQVPLKH